MRASHGAAWAQRVHPLILPLTLLQHDSISLRSKGKAALCLHAAPSTPSQPLPGPP